MGRRLHLATAAMAMLAASLAGTAAMAFTGPPCDCAAFQNWIHS
jgi:hypothetical protein